VGSNNIFHVLEFFIRSSRSLEGHSDLEIMYFPLYFQHGMSLPSINSGQAMLQKQSRERSAEPVEASGRTG